MHLTPSDQDKLLLSMAGLIARERRDRCVMHNYPEAMALLSCWVIERARDGASVEQLTHEGLSALTRAELMEGVPETLVEVQVDATFPDGPQARYDPPPSAVIPGEFVLSEEAVELAPGHERRRLSVLNGGDRPIQVGSHFHFVDSNAALEFDRGAAKGSRLDIPAGTSVRFEPGIERDVGLVALGGERIVAGPQIRSGGRP